MLVSSPLINSINNNRFIKVSLKQKCSRPTSLKVRARRTIFIYKFLKLKGIKRVREKINRVKISL